ncbi:NADPH-dependent FMN reductase [Telluribacter sp. SYSU D00476]|uniref:NADPH-dependent FMN reductase n=1 Tax=Telluribacter sp. SYSU D00476 TaxID=2811430 RepID=UPI001FF2CF35|nr:NAD(P)H-dependent oxidoreductase [Telluribacter sp. SYSU D00476]
MKKIIAFAGSNSTQSINRKLVEAATRKLPQEAVQLINLADIKVPIYGIDVEEETGIPESIRQLHAVLAEADGFIIASPEHNGLLPAFFKNIIDWLSRIDQNIFGHKPVLLMSTSTGGYGGQSSLSILKGLFPRWGGHVVGTFSVGPFQDKYDEATQSLTYPEDQQLTSALEQLSAEVFEAAPAA